MQAFLTPKRLAIWPPSLRPRPRELFRISLGRMRFEVESDGKKREHERNSPRAAAAASSARTILSFCGTFTLSGVVSILFHSVRGDPAIGDEKRVFTTADGDGRGFSLVSVTWLELQNSSFLPLDLQSGMFDFLNDNVWSRNWNVLAVQAPLCSFPSPLINLWRLSKEEVEDGACSFTEIDGAFFRPSSGEVILLGLGEM